MQDASDSKRCEELMTETRRAGAVRATRITVETETLVLVRRARAVLAWCPDCRAEVDVIALDKLTEPVTAAQIHEWFGANDLHFWQMAEGSVRICVKSLLQSLRRVSTTLRQVLTKFSEFFICCQFSTRKFASGSPRNDDRQLGGPTACPFLSLLGAHFVSPKSLAARS